jgi:glutathione S-transferase
MTRPITESSDIVDYLDRHFPDPSLRPSDPAELERMFRWLKRWDETQIWLKTLSHNTILKERAASMRAEMGKLEALVHNDELVEFMRELTSERGLSQSRLERATNWIERMLDALNQRLAQDPWLAGVSLADLAWSVDIHRFELIKYPIDEYPAMLVWYRKIEARPSFQRMVLDHQPHWARV